MEQALIALAMHESAAYDRCVRLPHDAELEKILLAECHDFADNGPEFEFWGENWRIHLVRTLDKE